MKIIKYKFLSCEVNHGTEENPVMEQIFLDKFIECKTKAIYDANMPIAEKEAIPGTLDPDNDGEFEETEPTDAERIAELEEALAMLLNGVTE